MPPAEEAKVASSRAIWSGTITFGLVSLPVEVYPGNRPRRVSLRLVDESGAPLKRRYYCPHDERPLSNDEIVRGVEVQKGTFVVLEDEELEAVAPEKSREIDLRRFVDRADIDPIYFERAYFMVPARGAVKPYRLLATAMEDEGRAGMATFVMRGKEYLVAIVAEGGILRAETMRFEDEIRSPEEVGLPEPETGEASLARKLEGEIEKLSAATVDERELADVQAERLLALIEDKQRRGEGVLETQGEGEPETSEDEPADLMDVLKASLSAQPALNGGRRRGAADDGEGRALADRSKAELYRQAKELEVPGRSSMSKEQLIRAIEEAR